MALSEIPHRPKMPGQDYETFNLGDWALQSRSVLPDAHIAYKTFGDPSSPAIVYPTWYSGCTHLYRT
jgi:homoserine acetyltransferase